MKVRVEDWLWVGIPMHFVGAQNCMFRLSTIIGKYIVSTVGQYRPPGVDHNIEIGCDRLFETMVFDGWQECQSPGCECGMPVLENARELECVGYNTTKDAQVGHIKICYEYANL